MITCKDLFYIGSFSHEEISLLNSAKVLTKPMKDCCEILETLDYSNRTPLLFDLSETRYDALIIGLSAKLQALEIFDITRKMTQN